jgi:hypothetical protein
MFTQNEEHGNEFLFIFGQVRKNIDIENKRLKINGKKNKITLAKKPIGKAIYISYIYIYIYIYIYFYLFIYLLLIPWEFW